MQVPAATGIASVLSAYARFGLPVGLKAAGAGRQLHVSQYGAFTANALLALGDGLGWHVPAVDAQRLLLFDVRHLSKPVFQVRAPVLGANRAVRVWHAPAGNDARRRRRQWEHMMEYDPPHVVRLYGSDAASTTAVLANSSGAVHCCQYDTVVDQMAFPCALLRLPPPCESV